MLSFKHMIYSKQHSDNNVHNTHTHTLTHTHTHTYIYIYMKGKAIPLQIWTGPEGSKRLRLPDFKTIGT